MHRPISQNKSHSTNIAEKLVQIQKNIAQFCENHHRKSETVQLLAVSKTKPASDIQAAFDAGQVRFGENYLQESVEKIKQLADLSIEWHFIGSIQSNKTRDIAEHFDWVHTVDRLKIAHRLNNQRPAELTPLNICLEINISNEDSKSGMSLNELDAMIDEIISLPNLKVRGLMAIPAKAQDFSAQRKEFAKMQQAFIKLQQKYPQLDTLSMGMSGDMEAAIAEGSTMLRIGTAIFGERN